MTYHFLQCRDATCCFRFPAPIQEATAIRCPRCRGEVFVAEIATRSVDTVAPEIPATPAWAALLDNIRSIHNAGSIFRTADGAGFNHLYLCGITATPDNPRLAKAALGAHETVGWTYSPNGVQLAAKLRDEGHRLYALERLTAETHASLPRIINPGYRTVLVVGNEKAGIDPGILSLCDEVVSLPMVGRKSSLNAAVAFGIAAYYLRFGNDNLTGQIQEAFRYDRRRPD
jgi:tRNA G18 (ribose-2'-O)-methylase SpoU